MKNDICAGFFNFMNLCCFVQLHFQGFVLKPVFFYTLSVWIVIWSKLVFGISAALLLFFIFTHFASDLWKAGLQQHKLLRDKYIPL